MQRMEHWLWIVCELLLLLTVANGIPVLATRVLGERAAWPLDGGLRLADGYRLFGRSKTVRGIVLAVAVTALAAVLLGWGWRIGALLGAGAMLGDLLSSFVKRRLGIESSGRASGLDQIPEALLPLLLCYPLLPVDPVMVLLVVLLFTLGQVLISPLMFRLGVRRQPH